MPGNGSWSVEVFGFTAVADMTEIQRQVDRASMFAVREAGRKVGQAARREVPVKTGALKRSIASARRLRKVDGYYVNTVNAGRKGEPLTRFYMKQREAQSPYMRPAYESVAVSQMEEIAARAWQRATFLREAGR